MTQATVKNTNSTVSMTHCRRQSSKDFDSCIKAFVAQLGDGTMDALYKAADSADPEAAVHALEGTSGLMIIHSLDFGAAIATLREKKQRAKQFLIGNPLIAEKMLQHNLEAGLYAPLRVLIIGTDDGTAFIYDRPSTLFGQWNDSEVTRVARGLDEKLEAIVDATLN